ncbi:MAG: DUF559 domain-containing protein [Clostridia bacterium]|nr:DUF559 domain-containing protein [Clostridia bacterium]
MTSCERKLWYLFLRSYPLRFQRQKIIGEFIADFYCAKAHLIIEIDGENHSTPQGIINDQFRTKRIEGKFYKVIRINNEMIENNFYEVCEYIDKTINLLIQE